VGRGFSHDVSALDSSGVLTPEARKRHFSTASASLHLKFVYWHSSKPNRLKPVPLTSSAAYEAGLICRPYVVDKATTHKDAWVIAQAHRPGWDFRQQCSPLVFRPSLVPTQPETCVTYPPTAVLHGKWAFSCIPSILHSWRTNNVTNPIHLVAANRYRRAGVREAIFVATERAS